jgi:hypothetical protein
MSPRLLGAVKLERKSPPNVELLEAPIWWLPKPKVEAAEAVEPEPAIRSAKRKRRAQEARLNWALKGLCIEFTVFVS